MWILIYVDNVTVIAEDDATLKAAIGEDHTDFSDGRLTVSTAESRVLVIGRHAEIHTTILSVQVRGDCLQVSQSDSLVCFGSGVEGWPRQTSLNTANCD